MAARQAEIGIAERTRNVRYAIREIFALAQELKRRGREVIHLNIGDPIKEDFSTPPHMIEAIHRGMLEGDTGYSPSEGIASALGAIQRRAERKHIGDIRQICVTSGAGEGIELALTALVNPGENVLVPSPGYPLYLAVLGKLGGVANPYFLDERREWQPDVADMEAKVDRKTRAVVVINPNNPTGSIAGEDTLGQVVELARRHNLLILADEIYDEILFAGQRHTSLASLAGGHPCVTFNGLSKSYLAPGLRTGWSILSGNEEQMDDYTDAFMKLARARLCPNTPMQWCVQPALEGDQSHLDDMMSRITSRTELVLDRLREIPGFHCVPPKGAFYVFPSIDCRGSDWDFATGLLEETGVVTVPGSGFGQRPGTKHIRIVTLPPEETLSKAMDLIDGYVRRAAEVGA
jgi:alanine-synthesizing transaminase